MYYMSKEKIKDILYNLKNRFNLFYLINISNIQLGLFFAAILVFMLSVVSYTNRNLYNPAKFRWSLRYHLKNNYDELPEINIHELKDHVSFKVLDDGYNIYAPVSGRSGYRYGPSIIRNEDGSLDAWFSSPGNAKEWDWISYQHSDDGINWSKEKIVLEPTANSMDHYSCCDPGVIYFNGYYYLGYTSTITSTNEGINNNVYVARSTNPDGPYEKWNGNGWGGKPEPIIYYDESNDRWGAGEISFVVANDTLYCYYTWDCEHGNFTKVSTAKLIDDWPNTLEYQGIIYDKRYGQDSCDVVYLDNYDKFVSFAIAARFTNDSCVVIYESDDGINFKKSDFIHSGISMYAHNMGISKGKDGHISKDDDLLISYAYSNSANSKGKWATRIQPINLIVYKDEKAISQDQDGQSVLRNDCYTSANNSYTSGLYIQNKTMNLTVNGTATVNPCLYNQYRGSSPLQAVLEYEYDDSIISINGNTVKGLQAGETVVKAKYKDFYTDFTVKVKEVKKTNEKKIVKFEPVKDSYELHIEDSNYHTAQVRAYVEFDNGKWGEAYNDYTINHPRFPAMIDGAIYPLRYESEDNDIVSIDNNGIIYPNKVGETYIKVTIDGDLSFKVKVVVKF